MKISITLDTSEVLQLQIRDKMTRGLLALMQDHIENLKAREDALGIKNEHHETAEGIVAQPCVQVLIDSFCPLLTTHDRSYPEGKTDLCQREFQRVLGETQAQFDAEANFDGPARPR